MSLFTAETVNAGDSLVVKMTGPIDEHADFENILASGSKPVVVDLEKVTRINSIGIRTWMMWFRKLNDRAITLRACPKIVVDQFNLVADFLPKAAKVESFFVPFYCEECEDEQYVLIHEGTHFVHNQGADKLKLPDPPACLKCQKPTELDVNPKMYFRFLGPK